MAVNVKIAQPVEYFRKFLEQDTRPDGRGLSEARPVMLNVGSITTAEGSALVKLGNTAVLCGIKAELTVPKDDAPTSGLIVPNVDLPPVCSPMFKPGPPSEMAQAASMFMNDVITSSKCLSLEDLCIVKEKLCWVLYCDMICLDYDGNLLDACSIAMTAALKNTMLPHVELSEETELPQANLEKKKCLNITSCPISTTFAIFDDKILFVDPTQEEEAVAGGLVSIVTSEDVVHIINKPGGSPLSAQQLQDCICRAKARTAEVTRLIEETVLNVER